MSKAGAGVVLKCLLGLEKDIDIGALPWGEDDGENLAGASHDNNGGGRVAEKEIIGGYETVVLAREVRARNGCDVRVYR